MPEERSLQATNGFRRTPPESVSDYALRSIRSDLVEGRLLPGERLGAERVADALNISHVPVREAIRYLEAEGHLERDGRSTIRVRRVTHEEAEEIYRLRQLLETEIHLVGVPSLTDEDLIVVEEHYRSMQAAVAVHDIAAFARANRSFHFVAFARADMPWMQRFLEIIWDAAARYQTWLFRRDGWEQDLQRHHAALLDAMRVRDANLVNRIMDEHRQVTLEATRSASLDDADATSPSA